MADLDDDAKEYGLRWSGTDDNGCRVVGAVTVLARSEEELKELGLKYAKGVHNLKLWVEDSAS